MTRLFSRDFSNDSFNLIFFFFSKDSWIIFFNVWFIYFHVIFIFSTWLNLFGRHYPRIVYLDMWLATIFDFPHDSFVFECDYPRFIYVPHDSFSTWFIFTRDFPTRFIYVHILFSTVHFFSCVLFTRFFFPHVLIFQVITYCCECSSSDGVNNLSAPPWLHQWTKRPQWRPPLIWHSDSIL